MVAKRPEDRPASMTAVLARLEALPRGRTAPAVRRRMTPWLVAVGAAAVAACLAVLVGLRWAGWTRAPAGVVAVAPAPDYPSTSPKKLTVETVRIEAGDFPRGSPESDRDAQDDEKPQKKVTLSHPFLLAKTKVTQALFQKVMGKNPSIFSADGASKDKVRGVDTADHPVESVRWIEAIEFCNKLSERDGLEPYYRMDGNTVTVNGGDGWRLPTEAEWEYACRAGTDTRWSFGDDPKKLGDYAWFEGNSDGRTHPVGLKKANPWGLYDMGGDVPEWCWDRYDPKSYQKDHLIDPTGAATGDQRVFRGGGWNDDAAQTRSASRQSLGVAYGGVLNHIGIRVARDAPP
jgi:formylglycine-generating enzyme required for sulfatase activity